MKFYEIYTKNNKDSEIKEIFLEFNDNGVNLNHRKVDFITCIAGTFKDFHNPPEPQMVILLQGTLKIITSTGKEILLNTEASGSAIGIFANDVDGAGHQSKALTNITALIIKGTP